jgi:hypothetical protein
MNLMLRPLYKKGKREAHYNLVGSWREDASRPELKSASKHGEISRTLFGEQVFSGSAVWMCDQR